MSSNSETVFVSRRTSRLTNSLPNDLQGFPHAQLEQFRRSGTETKHLSCEKGTRKGTTCQFDLHARLFRDRFKRNSRAVHREHWKDMKVWVGNEGQSSCKEAEKGTEDESRGKDERDRCFQSGG